jgi:hypothetical protein
MENPKSFRQMQAIQRWYNYAFTWVLLENQLG